MSLATKIRRFLLRLIATDLSEFFQYNSNFTRKKRGSYFKTAIFDKLLKLFHGTIVFHQPSRGCSWISDSPVAPAGAICLKCWNTSNLFDSFAIRAKQEITILVLRSASFREALSICRLALSHSKPLWHHAKLTWVIIELQQEGIFSQNLKWKRCITVKFFLFVRETFLPGMENLHCN